MSLRHAAWGLLVGAAVAIGWQAAQSAPVQDEEAELYRLFVDALEHIDRSYVKPVNRRELIESAINGMLEGLDPYSNFIPPTELKSFNRATVGKFGGIGVQIGPKEKNDEYLSVISPLVGTPAYEAGVIAGDRILKVNGESVKGMTQSEVVERLTGPPGTAVTITVLHKPYKGEPRDIELKRDTISTESVQGDRHDEEDRWEYMLDPQAKIAYIRITSFTQSTKDDLERVLQQLLKEGMKGLVLDLRYNPGGLLSSAIEVADLFVDEGTIVSTRGRNTEDKVYVAKKDGTLPDFPMVVLVNGYSASASEVVSACLQDHKRAIVLGERTYGKGSVQNVIELEGGSSALKLTTAGYTRPNGHNIHKFKDSKETDEWGVKPDSGFEVKFSPEEHRNFHLWRMARDRVEGKAAIVKKVAEDTAKAEKEAKEAAKAAEAKKEAAKPEKKDAPKAKDAAKDEAKADEKGEKAEPPEVVKDFEDRQLQKALEYLRGKIDAKPANVANAAKKS